MSYTLNRYTLHPPFEISARLMPAIVVGGATLSLDYGEWTRDGRMQWDVWIDLPGGGEHQIDDLRSGVGGGTLQEGFAALLSFLGAAAESRQYREQMGREYDPDDDENEGLFEPAVVGWASENSDELSILAMEIEETKGLIEEE